MKIKSKSEYNKEVKKYQHEKGEDYQNFIKLLNKLNDFSEKAKLSISLSSTKALLPVA